MAMFAVPVLAGLAESVAVTFTVDVPAVVGVPVMAQLAAIVRPAGRLPELIAQVYGAVPPATPMLPLYGVLTVASAGGLSVSDDESPSTVMVTGAVVVLAGLAESVAVMFTVDVPAVVGVPVMMQLDPSVRPAGNVPEATEQVYGGVPPRTRTTPMYGTLTTATGGAVMVSVTRLPSTVMVTGDVLVLAGLAESVAVMLTVDVPGRVGVPVITQLEFSTRPAGSEPDATEQVYGATPPATTTNPT